MEKLHLPPPPFKHSFILWLALRGRLNTKDLWLSDHHDSCSVFCKRHPKTISHLFFRCTFVSSIWRRIHRWLKVNRSMLTLNSTMKWIKKDHVGAFMHNKVVVLAFAAVVYCIWSARKKMLFAGRTLAANDILVTIQTHVLTILVALYPLEAITF